MWKRGKGRQRVTLFKQINERIQRNTEKQETAEKIERQRCVEKDDAWSIQRLEQERNLEVEDEEEERKM